MAYGRRRIRGPVVRDQDPREAERARKRHERMTQKYGHQGASDVIGGRGKWQKTSGGKYAPASASGSSAKEEKSYTYRFKPTNLVMGKKYKSEKGGAAQKGVHVKGKLLYVADWKLGDHIQKASNYVSFMKKHGVPLEGGEFVSDPEYRVDFDKDGYPIIQVNRKFYYQGEGNMDSNQKRKMRHRMAVPLPGVFEGTLHEAVNELSVLLSEDS